MAKQVDEKAYEITLKRPLTVGEQVVEKLTLREPLAGDLRGVNLGKYHQGDVGEVLKVLANITDIPVRSLNYLGSLDVTAITSILLGFITPESLPSILKEFQNLGLKIEEVAA